MSKREGHPNISGNGPETKKPKLCDEPLNPQPLENAPQQRPKSPVAGPSSAPSDPELQTLHTGIVPIFRYFDYTPMQESSSQGSSSLTDIGPSTSFTNSTSSTTVEFGDSRTTSVEDMDIDSDTTDFASADDHDHK